MQIKKANKNEQQVHQRIKEPTVFNKHNGFLPSLSQLRRSRKIRP